MGTKECLTWLHLSRRSIDHNTSNSIYVVTKTRNQPKAAKTTQNHQQNLPKPTTKPTKPTKTTQNRLQYTLIWPVCVIQYLSRWPSVMLRDCHVDNHARNFLGLYIVFFPLKLSRKVKACSLAENRRADIFLQLKLMSSQNNNKFSSGDSDIANNPKVLIRRNIRYWLKIYIILVCTQQQWA